MSVIVKGGGGAAKQEKTVTAGTYVKEVLPDTGKLLSKVFMYPTPTEEKTVTPSTSQQIILPSDGKHLSKVIMEAMEDVTPEVTAQTPLIKEIIEGLVGKAQGATASAETILKGFSAYVNGKLVDGTMEAGVSGIDFGKVTFSADNTKFNISHGLGKVPPYIFIQAEGQISASRITVCEIKNGVKQTQYGYGYSIQSVNVTSDKCEITTHVSMPFGAYTYYWFAIA